MKKIDKILVCLDLSDYSEATLEGAVTIAGNSPEGLRISNGSEIKIRSSALSNNTGGNCAGLAPDSLRYNISSDASCGFTDPTDISSTDPLLEPLAANGGIAPSHALGVGSPAIDSGVPDLCIATDQNGTSRPQGPWCDRGAHENIYSDLVITDITLIGTDRIECHYENQGAAVLPEGRDIWIDVILGPAESEVPPFTAANIGIGTNFFAGSSGSLTTAPISPVPSWPHLVSCRIDPSNQIPELDETNNIMTLTLSPIIAPLPFYSYICTVNQNAFGRFAPDIRSEALFVALEGKQFEVLAKSEIKEPVWYFGKNEQGVEGWMAELVLDCEEIDPKQLLPREAPDFKIPEEKPDGEPLTCKPDLPNREICEEAGGTWVIVNTRANGDYCDCSLK